jgi:hypothetical protein
MVVHEFDEAGAADRPRRAARMWPGLYVLVVFAALVGAFGYHMHTAGIFSCPARDYAPDTYLGYCQGSAYGDYDHGAVWLGLEPGVREAAAAADVMFVGNSRLQFGLSTPPLGQWFAEHGLSYYLLGFSHNETARFTQPLLEGLRPQARAYVISVDKFFFERESPPAAEVMHAPDAAERYAAKRAWQAPHRLVCGALPALCGNEVSFYRQRATGAWKFDGSNGIVSQVIESDRPEYVKGNPELVATVSANAREFIGFLERQGIRRDCVILTYIPSPDNNRLLANAIASAVGLDLLAPQGEGLKTLDGSHLDPESAATFATAFLAEAGPRLEACFAGAGASTP